MNNKELDKKTLEVILCYKIDVEVLIFEKMLNYVKSCFTITDGNFVESC